MKIDYSDAYQGCFVCGRENPKGLHLDFSYDEETREVFSVWKPQEYMQGFEGIVHGGFISMLCDEIMAKACLAKNIIAVTGTLEIRFKKPVYVHEEIWFFGRVIEKRGKKIRLKVRCSDRNGIEKATALGLFIELSGLEQQTKGE